MLTRLIALLGVVLSMVAGPAQAQDRFTERAGGRGGQQFILRCPGNTVLTGLSSRQGAYINYIAPICDDMIMRGAGGTGNLANARCPSGSFINRVVVTSLRSDNHLLKNVGFSCYARQTGKFTASLTLDSPGQYTNPIDFLMRDRRYPYADLNCGQGRIVGIQGRSGSSVDALGLICSG